MLGHMVNRFAQLPEVHIGRSTFNRSSSYTSAFNAGYLIPIYCEEIYPGDTFKVDSAIFARTAPLVAPMYDNWYLDTFWFFTPNRLVWNNWQKFNGEQENPGDSTDYLVPQVKIPENGGFALESIYDYFGLPVLVNGVGSEGVNALPLRMYNLIYNEWFRDENIQNSLTVNRDDGPDNVNVYSLQRRNKKKDYFTSMLPLPQRGDGVGISVGVQANVYGSETVPLLLRASSSSTSDDVTDSSGVYYSYLNSGVSSSGSSPAYISSLNENMVPSSTAFNVISKQRVLEHGLTGSGIYADIESLDPITITTLRYASILQKFREKNARGGTRYIEMIRNHFGVTSPDARLQRPEYLGGSSSLININPVTQNSSTDNVSPQGNLTANGVVSSNSIGFRRSFTEHGFVIGLAMVRCDISYQQGLHKMWSRRQLVDYYFPLFNGMSEMGILGKELKYSDDADYNNSTIGYQERFSELRFKQNIITGKMRSIAPTSLDVWHSAQYFSSNPVLNSDFIQDKSDVVLNRALAVQDEPQILFNAYFSEFDTRPLPVHSIPGMGANL